MAHAQRVPHFCAGRCIYTPFAGYPFKTFLFIRSMYKTEISIRVRYAETDRMGYSYYGNYATYFEVARVEALRSLGISYRSLEDSGILLPVTEYQIKFYKPALYDDELIILTTIPSMPGARIRFEYATYRGDTPLNAAWTELAFVDKQSGIPQRCPGQLKEALSAYFK